MNLNLDNQFTNELPADPNTANNRRQIEQAAYSFVTPRTPSAPRLLHVADDVATMLGLSFDDTQSDGFLRIFSGAEAPTNARPFSMCYGGHQFGHWAGQLGDGRAINLGELSHADKRWMLQLKGAGETPYSRTADGLAVLRSSLREHLCSEAMYHLGIATTRSLCLITTGDEVMRDVMYDGNPQYESGAIVCRVAPSFIRFGNFQIFTARRDVENLRRLTHYVIKHYFPDCSLDKTGYVDFFREVSMRTLEMVIDWQRVGFVHGVMNTDNMSIHGETIDYGPYGWLEGYDHDWTPNTTDRQYRRYRFGDQPQIALWNLAQLANALFPLVEEAAPLESIFDEYRREFAIRYRRMMGEKIGIQNVTAADDELIGSLETTLQLTETDMTIFFRNLAQIDPNVSVDDDQQFLRPITEAFYQPVELADENLLAWQTWFRAYLARVRQDDQPNSERIKRMNAVNPKYVLRNYMAQLAIDAAERGDVSLIDELYQLLKRPYDEQPEQEAKWFAKRPDWARHKIGCSMLSCSS